MVVDTVNEKCDRAVVDLNGATIETCKIIEKAGTKTVEVVWGETASNAVKFGLKLTEFVCSSSDYKTLPMKAIKAVKETVSVVAEAVIMVPLDIISSVVATVTGEDTSRPGTICIDWNERASVYREGQYIDLPLKDVRVGDNIMTLTPDLKPVFTPVMIVTHHAGSLFKVVQITASLQSGESVQHRLVSSHYMYFFRDMNSYTYRSAN